MNIIKSVIVSGFVLLTLNSCNQQSAKNNATVTTQGSSSITPVVEGNYVTPDYEKRNEGYDWVGVSVQSIAKDKISIKIRSRADKKKPTCTLDAQATKAEGNTYRASLEGKPVLFTFDETSLTIAAENPQDSGILSFYCSGGASIAGTYKKTTGSLDTTQSIK